MLSDGRTIVTIRQPEPRNGDAVKEWAIGIIIVGVSISFESPDFGGPVILLGLFLGLLALLFRKRRAPSARSSSLNPYMTAEDVPDPRTTSAPVIVAPQTSRLPHDRARRPPHRSVSTLRRLLARWFTARRSLRTPLASSLLMVSSESGALRRMLDLSNCTTVG